MGGENRRARKRSFQAKGAAVEAEKHKVISNMGCASPSLKG